MNKRYNKLLTLMLSLLMTMVFTISAVAGIPSAEQTGQRRDFLDQSYEGKTVVLSTNDVHGQVDGYQYIKGLKTVLESRGADVIMVDAGDFSQGDIYVSTNKGSAAVNLMRLAGYDYATLGNHEFDFGPEIMNENIAAAQDTDENKDGTPFTILCSNILDNNTNLPKYQPSAIYHEDTMGDLKIGFIGVSTPETQTKSIPTNFENVYFNAGNADQKQALYEDLDARVAQLREDGADVVIMLAHLGVDAESEPFRSEDVYAAMSNKVDLIIDGHSHTVMTAGANNTPIMSTGTKFQHIGVTVINETTQAIETRFLYQLRLLEDKTDKDTGEVIIDKSTGKPEQEYTVYFDDLDSDADVKAYSDNLIDTVDADFNTKFAETKVKLNGEKSVKNGVAGNRDGETNLGDLIADSIIWYVKNSGTDLKVPDTNVVAVTNGGGIRATIAAGDITKKNVNTVLPFGNTITAVTVTGDQLLEALEASTFAAPGSVGGFPQISGMNIEVDVSKAYDKNDTPYGKSTYYGPKTINRVTIKDINGQDFDSEATYVMLTNNFCSAGGDTYFVLKNCSQFDTSIPLDEALMDYIFVALNQEVGEEYAAPQGRLVFTRKAIESDLQAAVETLNNTDTAALNLSAEDKAIMDAAIENAKDTLNSVYKAPNAESVNDVLAAVEAIPAVLAELNAIDTSKYSGTEKTAVDKAVAAAKEALSKATSTAAVQSALSDAKTTIANQKTDAQKKADADKAADEKAKKIKTVTVNVKTVNAKAIDDAVKKAGGSEKYVTKIVLGKKVSKISASAFKKYTKVTTLEIKSKKLKKAKVKKSLKGSKVKTVKVNVGKKKANKKFVKKYKKIFTKKNAGKKVKIK